MLALLYMLNQIAHAGYSEYNTSLGYSWGCPTCGRDNRFYGSKFENYLLEGFVSKGIKVIQHYRNLGFEIDLYLPDYKVGVELNVIYWHAIEVKGSTKMSEVPEDYHLMKSLLCEREGIRLIHIFEDQFSNWSVEKLLKEVETPDLKDNECVLVKRHSERILSYKKKGI